MDFHFETEIVAAAVLLVILLDGHHRLDRSRQRDRIFFACLIAALVSSVIDIADSLIDLWSDNPILLTAARTCYYAASTLPALLWFMYLIAIIYKDQEKPFRFWSAFGYSSFVLYLLFLVINLFTPILFSFDAKGVVTHGVFYNAVYAFCIFYSFMFCILLFWNIRKINDRRLLIDLLFLPVIVWIGLALEIIGPNWIMLGPSYAVALLSAYLFIQNETTDSIVDRLSLAASTDALTGLANRFVFDKVLASALNDKEERSCALILVDIDNLKRINDTFGHPAGDKAIITVGNILQDSLKSAGTVARIGGDEFAVVMFERPRTEIEPSMVALLERFEGLFIGSPDGNPIPLRCSVGIAFKPKGDKSLDTLYHHADVALYSVKRDAKYSYAFYDPEMEKAYQHPLKS